MKRGEHLVTGDPGLCWFVVPSLDWKQVINYITKPLKKNYICTLTKIDLEVEKLNQNYFS